MNSQTPIDVIVPVYNGAAYIREALVSIEQQTIRPTQVIVVNDGSTDQTTDIVNQFCKGTTLSVRQVYQKNRGLSAARNTGIKLSTSEYVAFLDADDVWDSQKLERQLDVFLHSKDEQLGVVYGRYRLIDEFGQFLPNYFFNPENCLRGEIFSKLLESNQICGSGSAVMIKKKYIQQVGFFDEQLRASEDWDYWLRLSKICTFDYVDQIIVFIRRHTSSMQTDAIMCFLNQITFYRKWIHELPDMSSAGDAWALYLSNTIFHRMRVGSCRPVFILSVFRLSPDMKRKIFWRANGSVFLYLFIRASCFLKRKIYERLP